MSINHEYTVWILANQRHDELIAEARFDALARELHGGKGWWRRLLDRLRWSEDLPEDVGEVGKPSKEILAVPAVTRQEASAVTADPTPKRQTVVVGGGETDEGGTDRDQLARFPVGAGSGRISSI